ncbi:MAG: T9SS type A sorting domain-containing protein [Bacteroidales bacterium]|nr:T9SS type A sorting domain-containing protein [Bacteroidales bacterium]
MKLSFIIFILFLTSSPLPLFPQISQGGMPASFNRSLLVDIPEVSLPVPAFDKIRAEDDEAEKQGFPRRVGVAVKAGIDVIRDGKLDVLPDGTHIWRISVSCNGALAISPYFDDFSLIGGCRMFVYDESKKVILGAYTFFNNKENRLFSTELVPGDHLVIEINADPAITALPSCVVSEISYVYRDLPDFVRNRGTADDCEVNINCPEGDNWQNQKRGVARIYVKHDGGFFWCTGSLLNNILKNREPYFLTADHCAPDVTPAELSEWIFYFNFEAPGCENPTFNPTPNSLDGAVKLANANTNGSDFLLLRFDNEVPENYEPYFNGWNIDNQASPNGVTIHHPAGDIKKISTYTVPLQSSQWSGTLGTHWLVYWSETESGWGVTEGGSSGSPLFDYAGKIVGTLTGGQAACDSDGGGAGTGPDQPDYYGKFSYSWDQNGSEPSRQLKYWLDPLNSGVTSLTGMNASLTAAFLADKTLLLIGNTVKYSNLSSGLPVSWEWTFEGGDPESYSGAEPPEIKYLAGGMFDTKLIVSDGADYDTLLLTDYIHVVGKVFPNPVSDFVNIYLEAELPVVIKAEVFNIIGQKVLEKEFPDQDSRLLTIDLSSLSAGIYVVRLQVKQQFIWAKVMVSRLGPSK